MKVVASFFLSIFLLFCLPSLGLSQFIYDITASPDSSEVYLNGQFQGKTPLKVKFKWENVPDSGMVFRVKKEGYLDQVFVLREKPRAIKTMQTAKLEKIMLHFDLDSASATIEFDKLLAEFPSGKKIGEVKSQAGTPTELTWDGFSRTSAEPIALKAYDVLGSAGFNTPLREEHQLFSTEKRVRKTPRFLLGAKVTELWVSMQPFAYSEVVKTEVKIGLEWQVFDRSTNQVVLKGNSTATETQKYRQSQSDEILADAFGSALNNFLAKETLYELIKAAGTGSTIEAVKTEETDSVEAVAVDVTHLAKVTLPKFESGPEMIQYATTACVTISTDGGHGSGVIISDNGLILTAAHVIEGVNRLDVVFSNGVELEGKVLATDAKFDVALVKVPGSKYKALPIGKGLAAALGQEVITIGTPGDLELGQSIAKGIVSGKRKHEEIVYIQTDLAVSPGNSGGPLIDSNGQIIGIVQRKLIGNGIEGVNFALPIETAMKQLRLVVEE